MSNLISESVQELYSKIGLFEEYDPTQYSGYPWISDDTLSTYHQDCYAALLSQYDEVAGDLASIDDADLNSIALGEYADEEFSMEPADLTDYLEQGLTFEFANTADIFDTANEFSNMDMQLISGGQFLNFIASGTLTNNDIHPYPFTSMDWWIRIQYDYIGSSRYDYEEGEYSFTFHDLYRGPKDNIGDRGENYYEPVTVSGSGSFDTADLDPSDASLRMIWSTDRWAITTPAQTATYTLDNGATGTINLNLLWEIVRSSGIINTDDGFDYNGANFDFAGSITMPKYHWSTFTRTQSPNILRQIDSLFSTATPPKTTLFINAITDSLTYLWPTYADALDNAEELNEDAILTLVKSDLLSNKAVAEAQDVSNIKRYAKTYLANRVFETNANYALSLLGITTTASLSMTSAELAALNTELVAAGVTNFELDSGYYNWANVPECNSKDECSRFATALIDQVNDFDEMLDHPALDWMSGNYDYIEAELLSAKTELDKVI